MPTVPLQKFPVVRTASPGNLRDAVASLTGYNHDVAEALSSKAPPGGTVNGIHSDELSLVFVAYAAQVSVFAPPTHDRVVLVIPLGPMTVEVGGRREVMTVPFVLSAAADTIMYPDPVAGALVGSAEVDRLTELLRQVFGENREFAIDLTEQRPIRVGAATALRRTWTDFAVDPQVSSTTDLMDSLLVSLAPHLNYRAESVNDWHTPPNYLVHAVRHLRSNLSEPLSIARVAEMAGIGQRQLQLAFLSHLGCTAQEYLKTIRLDRAHALLSDRRHSAPKTVAEVSLAVGIPHQGRFAQYFTDRFGVLPSALTDAQR
jgi:AraC-like DNA-binding protein